MSRLLGRGDVRTKQFLFALIYEPTALGLGSAVNAPIKRLGNIALFRNTEK